MLKIGKFEIDAIDTGNFGLDGGAMFGVVPKALWERFYNKADESNRIPLSSRPLLVRWDDKKMLIDAGNGTKMPEKLVNIYNIDTSKAPIERGLSKYGVKPDEITDFVYTHLHFDHAGGSTKFNAKGEAEPIFTNAKHYVQKEQWDWANNPTLKDTASFIADDWMPVKENGMLEFTEGEGEIMPGIEVFPINGHTRHMQMIKISDAGETLLFMADLAPTTAHLRLPFGMGYDNFPLDTLNEKKKYFPRAVEENWTVVFEHDAFVQAGKIDMNEKGYYLKEEVKISDI